MITIIIMNHIFMSLLRVDYYYYDHEMLLEIDEQ